MSKIYKITNLINALELHYIQLYNSRNKKIGYNILPGGNRPGDHTPMRGTKEYIEKRDWAESMMKKF